MRGGIDQTISWVLAVFFSFCLVGALYALGTYLAQQVENESREVAVHELKQDFGFDELIDQNDEPEIPDSVVLPAAQLAEELSLPVQWTYLGQNAPEMWGDLNSEFRLCRSGKRQSPINIRKAKKANSPNLVIDYNTNLVRPGIATKRFVAEFDRGSYVLLDDDRYELYRMHVHVPSEHKIDGISGDAELQLFHRNDQGKILALALVAFEGRTNQSFQKILKALPTKKGLGKSLDGFETAKLLPAKPELFYSYQGSSTQPPCQENIHWLVLKNGLQISSRQVDVLVDRLRFNSRPTQPINKRMVLRNF